MNLGFGEIVGLLVLALLIFGPERLPGIARNAGRMIAQFKQEASNTLGELKRSADLEELRGVATDLRAQTSELKLTATLTGPIASEAKPARRGPARRDRGVGRPAPFDPDAP